MTTFLEFVGMLIFLFCACYFFAAMGNQNAASRGKPTDNFGCAVILFVAFLLFLGFKVIFGR